MEKSIDFDYTTNNQIQGLSGRDVTLGEWAKDIKSLKLGAVRLYDLLPRNVERRVKRERKEAFVAKHQALIADTQSKLDSLDEKKSGEDDEEKKKISNQKKELKLLLEQLKEVMESYEDHGPMMDIVMFEVDGVWKAVLDGTGDMSKSIPMAPFKHFRQTGNLGFGSEVTYCIQVYEKGNILSVVTDAGSHGTHVAGIAAANFNEETKGDDDVDISGVAPGAQILALKIGDGRLGSTETGAGLTRALVAAKKYGCDILNLSYGEASFQYNTGNVAKVFAAAVNDWNMAVFTSAGNDGPALSSIGSPGSETAPITVGAWLSPEMMSEQYSTLPPIEGDKALEAASYYFSSRGPTPDGCLPDICAPGGAISPIPRHALQSKAQYHGTSMSSPNACGVAASVLSAAKQKGINCNPIELKRGLVNTAVSKCGISDVYAQGAGLVSANQCAEYIIANHGKLGQNIAIDISIPSRSNARGIYIRDEVELNDVSKTFGVLVKPKFSHSNQRTSGEMEEILGLELDLLLKASDSWITCPERMTLLSAKERGGQSFSVRLDTKALSAGVHFATVDAFVSNDSTRGKIFSLPITVIVPHSKFVSGSDGLDGKIILKENGLDFTTPFELTPGSPDRRFITVPVEAEWATIKLRSSTSSQTATGPRVYLHAIPFVRGDLPNSLIQLKKIYQVRDGVEEEYHIRVKGGHTLELCLQLLWLANPSPATVTADIEWHSFNVRSPTLFHSQPVTITAAREFARLGINTKLRAEKINPSASLKSAARTLRPFEYDIQCCSNELLDEVPPSDAELSASPDKQNSLMYESRLRYKFTIKTEKDKKDIQLRPSFPSLFNQLYDSPVDTQLWSLVNSEGQPLVYGGAIHHIEAVSLKGGEYTVCLLLRHANRNVLEQMKDVPCELLFSLPDSLPCEVYSKMDKASTPCVKDDGRAQIKATTLQKGSHLDVYVSRPTKDLPSWIEIGDVLSGKLVLDKDKESVTSLELLYAVPPKSTTKDAKEVKPADDKKQETLDDAIFDAKLKFVAGLRKNATDSTDDYESHLSAMIKERPSSVPLLLERLTFALERKVPTDETEDEDKFRAKEVELVYGAMMTEEGGPIDISSLAEYFGINEPDKDDLESDEEAKTLNKDMKEQRTALRKVLLSRAYIAGKIVDKDVSTAHQFDSVVKDMKKWVSTDSFEDNKDKVQLTVTLAKHSVSQDKKATAISLLLKARKDYSGKELKQVDEELVKIYELLGTAEHLVVNIKEGIQTRHPKAPRKL